MAIKNASDLLVYKYTTPAQAEITRILVKSTTPFDAVGNFKINAVYKSSGGSSQSYRYNETITFTANTGTNVLNAIKTFLTTGNYSYSSSPGTVGTIGAYKYFDFTSPITGDAPNIFIEAGTSTPEEDAIDINITQDGQDVIYEPVAFSTSASLSMTNDLRDVTTKDSSGFQENAEGLKSFEVSTDALVNFDANVDADAFVEDFRTGNIFDVKFSDRIRNILQNSQIGAEYQYWANGSPIATMNINFADPFGGFSASRISSPDASNRNFKFIVPNTVMQGFYNHITFYVKGISGGSTGFSITGDGITTLSIIEGQGTVTSQFGGNQMDITGLSTSEWTRLYIRYGTPTFTSTGTFELKFFPGINNSITSASKILISSMQVEQNYIPNNGFTSYQDPEDINCYQGDVAVSSISIEAGVEENATYSCTLTGTSQLFKNGLSNELLPNTQFYDTTGWDLVGSVISIDTTAGKAVFNGTISGANYLKGQGVTLLTGVEYQLTYTVSDFTQGNLLIVQTGSDLGIPSAVGTHTVRYTNDFSEFRITGVSTINYKLSSVSLKKVRP